MGQIFQYIGLAMQIVSTVEAIIMLVASGALTGASLYNAVMPAISALHATIPKVTIPADLAQSVCNAVASAVATYHPPHPPAPVA